jgi:uncharacterized membrane protein YraQ (UPF0718 family)
MRCRCSGSASSSCSYAAAALARSIFREGANVPAAMAFEFASTNLVARLGIIMALIVGSQFMLGDVLGGPLMIVLLALLFRPSSANGSSRRPANRRSAVRAGGWRATPKWTCPGAGMRHAI